RGRDARPADRFVGRGGPVTCKYEVRSQKYEVRSQKSARTRELRDFVLDTTIMRTLIWGAGAIGGTLGAYLARAGGDVTLVDTAVDHVDGIARRGLRVIGPIDEFTV